MKTNEGFAKDEMEKSSILQIPAYKMSGALKNRDESGFKTD